MFWRDNVAHLGGGILWTQVRRSLSRTRHSATRLDWVSISSCFQRYAVISSLFAFQTWCTRSFFRSKSWIELFNVCVFGLCSKTQKRETTWKITLALFAPSGSECEVAFVLRVLLLLVLLALLLDCRSSHVLSQRSHCFLFIWECLSGRKHPMRVCLTRK